MLHEITSETPSRPRRFSESELAQCGVEVVDTHSILLRCEECGQVWSPNLLPNGGRLPRGYWMCPNACNC